MTETRHAEPQVSQRALWFGLFGGIVAWLVHLAVGFVLVYDGCARGIANLRLLVGVATLVLALVAAAAATIAYRAWRMAPEEAPAEAPQGARNGRDRFMAFLGIWLSALSLLIIVLLAIPIAWLDPCR